MFAAQVISEVQQILSQSAKLDLTRRELMLANLVFMHQVITASERLMEEAAQESGGELNQYFLSHIEEERGHALWLEDDLLTAGIDVKSMPLMRKATELAGSQYYLIKHVNPACLLGYMAVLEGFPTPLELVAELEAIHGKLLLRTLRYHAENDPQHRIELFSMVDKYACPEILANAMQTATYINEFASELR